MLNIQKMRIFQQDKQRNSMLDAPRTQKVQHKRLKTVSTLKPLKKSDLKTEKKQNLEFIIKKQPDTTKLPVLINKTELFFEKTQSQRLKTDSNERILIVGAGNNQQLIKDYFQKRHPQIKQLDYISNKYNSKFWIKWVQTLYDVNWKNFKEGQMVNHIYNIAIWATKNGLYNTIKEYEQSLSEQQKKEQTLRTEQFIPGTFRIDISKNTCSQEEQDFLNFGNENIWIFKPTAFNCGKGIYIVNDIKSFKEDMMKQKQALKEGKELVSKYFTQQTQKCIVQRYIEKPLLLENKKFDLRVYILIACTNPFFVLFHHGYVRLSISNYQLDNYADAEAKSIHLTNAFVQKKHPDFLKEKENSIWSMQKLEEYMVSYYKKDAKFIKNLYDQIKRILTYAIKCGQNKIEKRVGQFELLGCDILIDEEFNPYLIEMNLNPALWLDSKPQQEIIPQVINSTLDIVLKINENNHLYSKPNFKSSELNLGNFSILIDQQSDFYYK